jgi:site-specific DNA-cytosine methylase
MPDPAPLPLPFLRKTPPVKQYVSLLMRRVPFSKQAEFDKNCKATIRMLQNCSGPDKRTVATGDGCSGTSIYLIGLEAFLEYVEPDAILRNRFAADNQAHCKAFLLEQHSPQVLIHDVKEFSEPRVMNLTTLKMQALPVTAMFHAGFVCKDLSRLNNSRDMLGIRGNGRSSWTFNAVSQYIFKWRPVVSILENVPEIKIGVGNDEPGFATSDIAYVEALAAENNFTFIWHDLDAKAYGSPISCDRVYMAFVDMPPAMAKAQGLHAKVAEYLNMFRMQPERAEDYFMDGHQVAKYLPALLQERGKQRAEQSSANWKRTHEQFFLLFKEDWPPATHMFDSTLSQRECEVTLAANFAFPATVPGVWQWFDANNSLERSFVWACDSPHRDENGALLMKSPWRPFLPTATEHSAIVGRKIETDATVTYKVLNALEGFAMKGWTLDNWKTLPLASKELTYENLLAMLGNMWTLRHYLPFIASIFGSIEWPVERVYEDPDVGAVPVVASEDEDEYSDAPSTGDERRKCNQ